MIRDCLRFFGVLTIVSLLGCANFTSLSLSKKNTFNFPPCQTTTTSSWTNCVGTYIFPSGDKYEGEWRDGKRNGQGTFYSLADNQNKGDKYEGNYKDGLRHGQGTYIFANGSKFVGEWIDGKYNGQGTFYYLANDQYKGDKYEGNYKDGLRHGQGIYTKANGSVAQEGIWENDTFIRTEKIIQPTLVSLTADNERKKLEDDRRQLAEERKRLEEEKLKSIVPPPAASPPIVSSFNGRRFALVIGNSNYNSVPVLLNSTNDAREVAKALQASGFEVSKYENIDYRQMQDAVRSFGEKLGKNDVGLFYFAGHGVQVKGKNYLIPVRENIKKAFEVPSSALDTDLVLATMESAKNNLNIVILDACRSPFPGEGRSGARGLATLDAAKGTLIAFASAPGKEAMDGKGSNSPYTKNLVKVIQQKGLTIEQVFKQVRIAVVAETNGEQVPWENSSIMGEFYFRK